MSASSPSLAESVQNRLESLSMRLDAATDNLLQTRDLIIRNLEHQLLQLQEVRSSLHEAAVETSLWTEQATSPPAAATPPLRPAVNPMGELTLESLFAPLNAIPRVILPMPTPESVVDEVPFVNAEVIFECEPSGKWEPPVIERSQSTKHNNATAVEMKTAVQVSPTSTLNEIDPALEKATLDELNEALTRAFAQITNRQAAN